MESDFGRDEGYGPACPDDPEARLADLEEENRRLREEVRKLGADGEMYRMVLEQPFAAVYCRNLRTDRYVFLSPSIEGITGFGAEEFGAMSLDSVLDRICPEDLPGVTAELNAVMSGERDAGRVEYRFRVREGGTRWLADEFRVIRDERGAPLFRVGGVYDITERKRAEDALRESRERYRTLVDTARSIILRWKPDGTLTFMNKYGLEFFGYTPEELIGRNVSVLLPERDTNGRDMTVLVRGITRNPENYRSNENENIRRNGEIVTISWTNGPVFDEKGELAEIIAIGNDISGLKRTETALRESGELLRCIVENSPNVIFFQDRDLRYTWVANSMVPSAGARIIGKTDADISGFVDADRIAEVKRRVIETGVTARHELRIVIEGEERWFDDFYAPRRDDRGAVIGLYGYARDITERKRAEKELENIARFPGENPNPVFRVSEDGVILYSNEASAVLLGTLGIRPGEKLPEAWIRIIRDVIHSGVTADHELDCCGKWFLLTFAFISDADYVNVYGLDITERKRAENTLRDTNRVLEVILENTHSLIAYMTPDFTFIRVNRAYAEADGRESSFFPGKNHFELYPHEENEQLFRRVVETGEPVFLYARPFVYPDQPARGTTWWDWSIIPVKDESGRVTGLVFTLMDITERHLLQENVDRLRREQEAFLRHEIKNLFIPIQLFSELLLQDPENLTPEQIHYLRRIGEAADRVNGFVDALKRIHDLEFGSHHPRKEPRALDDLLRRVIADLEPKAAQSGVALCLRASRKPTVFPFDPQLMPGVFSNLILNAIEHVAGLPDPAEKVVNIDISVLRNRAVIRITNRGEPIPPERIGSFFDKFNVGPEKRNGTGLGTTYAFLVTRAHDGEIAVTSSPETGTQVTVIFPLM